MAKLTETNKFSRGTCGSKGWDKCVRRGVELWQFADDMSHDTNIQMASPTTDILSSVQFSVQSLTVLVLDPSK